LATGAVETADGKPANETEIQTTDGKPVRRIEMRAPMPTGTGRRATTRKTPNGKLGDDRKRRLALDGNRATGKRRSVA
jgi:hypothetical protein